MGRPRKPTNVLELSGAFKEHAARGLARANEPAPVGEIGDPPDTLSEYEKACWHEIVATCHAGTLCAADRLAMEHAARVLAALRGLTEYVDVKLMVRWEAILARFGLTPADRSRVSVIKPKDNASPLDEFAA